MSLLLLGGGVSFQLTVGLVLHAGRVPGPSEIRLEAGLEARSNCDLKVLFCWVVVGISDL